MDCTKFEEKLNAYFDRELDAEQRASFMEELRTNSRYRWDFKLYRKMFQVLERMEVDSPEDLPERIKEEIRQIREPHRLMPRAWLVNSPATYAMAAAALFFFALFLGRETRPLVQPGPLSMKTPAPQLAALPRSPAPAALQESQAGKIRVIPEGLVEVMRQGSITWTLAHAGDHINFEDRVRTGDGATVRLIYPDRAYIKVREDSLVQVLDEAIRVFQGDTWIKVEKTGSRFEARTPNAVASVRGTMYSVHVKRQIMDQDEVLRLASEQTAQSVRDNLPTHTAMAPVSALGTQVTLARHIWQQLLGSFRTDVRVYESTVAVAPLNPLTGAPEKEQLVHGGQGLLVDGTKLASVRPLLPENYSSWKLPVPEAILAASPRVPLPTLDPISSQVETTEVVEPGTADVKVSTSNTSEGPNSSASKRPQGGSLLGYQGLRQH
jgi:hypothetical protein